jgi:hypothetical protein
MLFHFTVLLCFYTESGHIRREVAVLPFHYLVDCKYTFAHSEATYFLSFSIMSPRKVLFGPSAQGLPNMFHDLISL